MRQWLSFVLPRSAKPAVWLSISIVLALTFLAFVGWAFNIALFKSVNAQWIRMSLITAVCLALSAIELAFLQKNSSPRDRRRIIVLAPGILVAVASSLSIALYLVRYAAGWEATPPSPAILYLFWAPATRMALLTSILFVAAAGAITLLATGDRRAANIAHAIAAPAAVASYVVPVGYLLSVPELTASLHVAVAMNTGLAFCALFAAVFCSRPDTWLMSVLQGDRPGAVITRRLLPALLIAPLVIGWLWLYGERSGLFGSGVGVVLVAVTYSVVLLWLVWANARSINQADDLRRVAERAVRESESRYHLLFEGMTEGFALCDVIRDGDGKPANCMFAAINPAFERLTGLPRNALVGKTFGQILRDDDAQFTAVLTEVATTGNAAHFDISSAAIGRRFDVHAYRPAPGQVAVVMTDVTEREQAEEALRRSEGRFRLLSATAGRLLGSKDPQSVVNELCRDVMAHLDCHVFFNYLVDDQPDRLRLNACAGIPDEEARRIGLLEFGVAVCGCVARDGARIVAENIACTTDPRTELVKSYGVRAYCCHPLMSQGSLIGTLSFGTKTRDRFSADDLELMKTVTDQVAVAMERIRAEQALAHANEELEQRVRERTLELEKRAEQLRTMAVELTQAEDRERRRLARVLHDHLQQLLVGAKFSLATARLDVTDNRVLKGLDQVKDLVNQAIDASRSVTSEICPPILYDGGLADAVQWLARWSTDHHGLRVDLHVDDRLDAPTSTRVVLFQAAREALLNVVKHAGVECAEMRLERVNGDQLKVVVADRGCGFDLGRQAPAGAMDGSVNLFGIGERLKWIGGRMELASAPGAGTQVALFAPIEAERAVRREPKVAPLRADVAPPAPPNAALRVMIVDDHRIVREGLALLLGQADGIEVVGQAEDGRQAIEMARRLNPDVVLMDITMPRMNGIDATRAIVGERPETRVIGLSMHEQTDMEKLMRTAGAVAYLAKDGPAEALIAEIRRSRVRDQVQAGTMRH